MKQFVAVAVLTAVFNLAAFAQETKVVTGYLVDKMCASAMVKKGPEVAMDRAAKHTRECAMEKECAASGYGIVSDGKWIGFDAKGNEQAAEYLKQTKKADHLLVDVKGSVRDNVLTVTSISETRITPKKSPAKIGA